MGKRRRGASSDSLDLFLDTICNAFGGLLFLAILLTLLVQMRSSDDSGESQETVSAVDFEKLALEVRTAERRRDELNSQVIKLKQVAGEISSGQLQQRTSDVAEIQQKLDQLVAQIQAESQQVETMLREMREIQEQMANLEVELPRAREDLANSQQDLAKNLKSREKSVEAPVERITLKSPICLLMRDNRVHVVFKDSSNQDVNEEHVEKLAEGKSTTVRPKAGRGFDVSSEIGIKKISDHLSQFSSTDRFCSIAVWPDSYGNFEKVKKLMLDGGFNYQLHPLTTEDRVSYGISDQAPLVQ